MAPKTHCKEMGIISMYILYSIKKKPQSGYDILKDIEEKTQGNWLPSKGTVYPIINQLEKDSLIHVEKTGLRSKKIFAITKLGKKALAGFRQYEKKKRENILKFRSLLAEIFGKNIAFFGECLLDIKEAAFSLEPSKKDKAMHILKKCAADLKKLR